MIAVITGDIIHSKKVAPDVWMKDLKKYLSKQTGRGKWQIYRGDSFQIETTPEEALEIVLSIKALIKSKGKIDVRMAIGIGAKTFEGKKIIESNGPAYIHSGERFESLKNTTLGLKSELADLNQIFDPILRLISFISASWKPATALTLWYALSHRNSLQKEIARLMGKDTTTVSKALKRGGLDELEEILNLYTQKIKECLPS